MLLLMGSLSPKERELFVDHVFALYEAMHAERARRE